MWTSEKGRTALSCAAYAVPLAYLSTLLAVTIHECLGHGLAAVLVGGEFHGFEIHLDAMGRASTSSTGRVVVLSAGIVVTTVLGVGALAAARLLRSPLGGLTLGIFALCLFHDGLPYAFWNALFHGRTGRVRGDVGRLLEIVDSDALRTAIVAVSGPVYAAALWFGSLVTFRSYSRMNGPLSRGHALGAASTLVAGTALGNVVFDWNRLVPGLGLRPLVLATVLQASIGAGLVALRERHVVGSPLSNRRWAVAIAAVWTITGLAVLAIVLRLRDGVYWG